VHWSEAGAYAVVRGKLHATPQRPRPAHAPTVPTPCGSFQPPAPLPSHSRWPLVDPRLPSTGVPKMKGAAAGCRPCGGAAWPVACNPLRPCPRRLIPSIARGPAHRRRATASVSNCRGSTPALSHSGSTTWPRPSCRPLTGWDSIMAPSTARRILCRRSPPSSKGRMDNQHVKTI
jgi:hypothetical protein